MATRTQIRDAFVAAKKKVAANRLESSWDQLNRKHEFICHALDDVKRTATLAGVLGAKALIVARFNVPYGGQTNIETWLRHAAKVPQSQLTNDNLQAYRHRWLDSVIKEFS